MTSGYRESRGGLRPATATVTFQQDFAAGEVHATLEPLYASGSSFPLIIKPTSSALSATNPGFTMTSILLSYSFLSGSVGEKSTIEASFTNADTTGPVFDITP